MQEDPNEYKAAIKLIDCYNNFSSHTPVRRYKLRSQVFQQGKFVADFSLRREITDHIGTIDRLI